METLYASTSLGTAKNTFTAESTVNDTAGMGVQYCLPAHFWSPNQVQNGRGIKIVGKGTLSSTGTPTFTPTIRLGGSGSTTGPIIGGASAGLTTVSNANSFFEIELDVIMKTIGAAGANSTVMGLGRILCTGLANSIAPLWANAAAPPSTVSTVDHTIDNYININFACSASAAANQIQLFQLLVFALN
jgi:hypothetical protein